MNEYIYRVKPDQTVHNRNTISNQYIIKHRFEQYSIFKLSHLHLNIDEQIYIERVKLDQTVHIVLYCS